VELTLLGQITLYVDQEYNTSRSSFEAFDCHSVVQTPNLSILERENPSQT